MTLHITIRPPFWETGGSEGLWLPCWWAPRPFYAGHGLPVEQLLTANGRESCCTDAHPYELHLTRFGIRYGHLPVTRIL